MNRPSNTLGENGLKGARDSQVEAFYEEPAKMQFGVRSGRIMRKQGCRTLVESVRKMTNNRPGGSGSIHAPECGCRKPWPSGPEAQCNDPRTEDVACIFWRLRCQN